MSGRSMISSLDPITDALAGLANEELHALADAAAEVVVEANDSATLMIDGLLSWFAHLAEWEINRRAGWTFAMQLPHDVIPSDEHEDARDAAVVLRERFAHSAYESLSGLFDAVAGALGGRTSL